MAQFKIVLVHPEIPGNTGTIGRTCVALDLELILIRPIAFDLDEKAVRRAGLDYWQHVQLTTYDSFDDFLGRESQRRGRPIGPADLHFFSRFAPQVYYKANFQCENYLIFGAETRGLPPALEEHYSERFYSLPHFSEQIRSLNLANCATAVAFEAIRQIHYS